MELLTEKERVILDSLAVVWKSIVEVYNDAPQFSFSNRPSGDLDEAAFYIHGLQNMILSQAAARAYPDDYRLIGSTVFGEERRKYAKELEAQLNKIAGVDKK